MKRRTFLSLASTGAGLSLLGCRTHASARPVAATGGRSPDVVVVGAGAFGSWTAWSLRQRGARVTLVDAFGPGNARSSSGGETRLIREDYGPRELYTRMAVRAFEHWRRYQKEWKARLFTESGRLLMAGDGGRANLEDRKSRLDRHDVAAEVIDQDELRKRWPQIHLDDIAAALYCPQCALLHARRACRVVTEQFVASGGVFRIGTAKPGDAEGRRVSGVTLSDRSRLAADAVVFACGPWLPRLFPELLGDQLEVIRRDVFFFGSPPGDDRFSHPNLPTWGFTKPSSDPGFTTYYGFPDLEGRGMKVCPMDEANTIDPDTDDRRVTTYQAKRAYDYVARRFPGMRGQPIVETRVCQITSSATGDYLVDRHPAFDNLWLVGRGSGHGFHLGPAIGEYVANRVLGGTAEPEYDAAFRLSPAAPEPKG